ncbi:glutamine--tRNA ligase [Thermodesulfomicrobium sp. WS]|uniref:glutamine--tRNA ligase/YqeY domain fusion protein n=1 Tax=Thermodesulfomicrobium sp. WS TaxID=3004129 RepID=UPI00249356F1|nr:glutamine--tRNA ligase/YqeY domain fusion protein [Thermodesulfomicrobium sp. WS]BDV00682.1 glutamine--tRNA ligase [Thermodesulfomicrobium sp. WS]
MNTTTPPSHFLREHIAEDLARGAVREVVTRFPPEPNGFLHIGHAKSICINFGLAREFGGRCHLRFDDTNPEKEDPAFVAAIKEDVRWLGFDWGPHLYHASDYFERLYQFAVELIHKGKAYVCHLSADDLRATRGTLTEPGVESPYRNRSVAENLDLFARMRAGEFAEGECTLRAKIDMASPNINLRDPVIYRILKRPHQNTGDAWCIYPTYDFAHGLSDALEGITHSICTLEFADHKPLYDWFLEQLDVPCHPQQIEFNRLNLTFTVTSKRKLKTLVERGIVDGWDDPRMPTLSGLRRRGVPPAAIHQFVERVGVSRSESCVDMALLESCIREELDRTAPRAMAVLRPVRLVITSYAEEAEEFFTLANHPKDPSLGSRQVPFCRELWIEADDFALAPPKGFRRLTIGAEVRLRGAYLVTCTGVEQDAHGAVTTVFCTHDPESRGGNAPDGRKVQGTIHWVSARHAVPLTARLYDRLFTTEHPGADGDFLADVNADSLTICQGWGEPMLAACPAEARFQLERLGYFCADRFDHTPAQPVFNRIVGLRDSWSKEASRRP